MQRLTPGQSIGILGSGQLGRMTAQAAKKLGFKTAVLSEEKESPAGLVADREVMGKLTDAEAISQFGKSVDRLTLEFENISADAAKAAESSSLLCPASHILHTTQNRLREKSYLKKVGIPTTEWCEVHSLADLQNGFARLGSSILKTADFGYDGKGQYRIDSKEDAAGISFDRAYILEKKVPFVKELSVIGGRSLSGEIRCFPLFENVHRNHILDTTISPAPVDAKVAAAAEQIVTRLLTELGYVGVLCVELFLTTSGELLVNELAPRPHNSGHLTIEGNVTSQFEQHVRAVADLPLGDTRSRAPSAMANLLGDLWEGGEPRWDRLKEFPSVTLHLYGKREARKGRKMGHLTATGPDLATALDAVTRARQAIKI